MKRTLTVVWALGLLVLVAAFSTGCGKQVCVECGETKRGCRETELFEQTVYICKDCDEKLDATAEAFGNYSEGLPESIK